ncbi:uncharacterized protein TRIREDRAFT_80578 [Trichoderma reesei QM6a]|uniref:Predicted protein n=2 Tax=Hypocrea jecorina TaxID=51453 RepID=G0RRH9_HYPJQ|nr:uncharacterized protein TRIREDRAFT_80578 [Trichoderma reesei QM6a]EGR46155.1 predicted protein [Trichoderma reesei QM6a]ETR99293.1 hypothetical protein M419DRAFT_138482 [Trichoderma reesei RUT C-30]
MRPINPLVQTKESTPPPLGHLVEAINLKELKNTGEEGDNHGITETELIASYNWADQKAPKIIVPGRPRLWKPLEKPRQLEEDNGVYYRDNNSAFFPKHPLEPAIVSVMKMHPQSLDIDIVGCNSTIGNLLRFVQGTERSFRMLVEVVGKTVHLIRRENSPKEQILGVRGFGHAFPEAYTTWTPDVRPSKSHHRILKLRFGGLDLLVRHSADGYIEDEDEKTSSGGETPAAKNEDLTNLLEGLSIGPASDSSADSEDLEVVEGGKITPQEAIFDLKTRSIKAIGKDTLGEELPRLWLARITKFILAHHTRGKFDNVEVADVHDEVKEWEKSHQEDLGRLSALLHRIQAIALENEDTLLEIVRVDGGPLEVRKRLPDAGVAFSDEVKEKWLKWLGHEAEEPHKDSDSEGDSDSGEVDLTACDAECGYCGKCSYWIYQTNH